MGNSNDHQNENISLTSLSQVHEPTPEDVGGISGICAKLIRPIVNTSNLSLYMKIAGLAYTAKHNLAAKNGSTDSNCSVAHGQTISNT